MLRAVLSRDPALWTPLGCDAVGVPEHYGLRLMARLSRPGSVFADTDTGWWWWIVPAGSDRDLRWPEPAHYAPGACIPAGRPRLIHWPDAKVPYTPPIPLYLMICQLAGAVPSWAQLG
ncbi:hypothetical protein [Streptomyces sp. NPDC050738]|uniref:hypothetical protein n=1 Tax=Streptomyces sp. NPDC050738 TaxID=3154744 RepID=UPI00344AA7E3